MRLEDDLGAMAFLKAQTLCSQLDEASFSRLCRDGRLGDFHAGQQIVTEGSTDDGLYVVLEGAVVVHKRGSEGRAVELATLERGGVFGEASSLTQQPRNASVVAKLQTRVIYLPGSTVRAVAKAVPRFGRLLAVLMAGRSKDADGKVG